MSPELWIIFVFGLGFLITRVILAVRFPVPTRDQEAVFRTVLSLSAAGIAAAIPGLMKFESQAAATTISATGALAVFALVYLLNPASVRSPSTSQATADNTLTAQSSDTDSLVQLVSQLSAQVRELSARIQELESQSVDTDRVIAPLYRARSRATHVLAAIFAGFLIAMLVVYALFFPAPTAFQSVLLRTVFALAGAALGALIPGTLSVASSGTRIILRATAALLMFVIIYFFSAMSVQ